MNQTPASRKINVVSSILKANDRLAEENRRRFDEAGVYVVDIIGSPGSGKTALIESTIPLLGNDCRTGVITADIATSKDAERIARLNIPTIQIQTEGFGGACHLEANTIKLALDQLDLRSLDLLFIENIGNLVCPAEFDLGHHSRATVISVTEGEEKPLKYPLAFRVSDAVLVSKTDLLEYLDYDLAQLRENIRSVNPAVQPIELSSKSGSGLDQWVDWFRRAMRPRSSGRET